MAGRSTCRASGSRRAAPRRRSRPQDRSRRPAQAWATASWTTGSKGSPAAPTRSRPSLASVSSSWARAWSERLASSAADARRLCVRQEVGLGEVEGVEHRAAAWPRGRPPPGPRLLVLLAQRRACGSSRSRPGGAGARRGTRRARASRPQRRSSSVRRVPGRAPWIAASSAVAARRRTAIRRRLDGVRARLSRDVLRDRTSRSVAVTDSSTISASTTSSSDGSSADGPPRAVGATAGRGARPGTPARRAAGRRTGWP